MIVKKFASAAIGMLAALTFAGLARADETSGPVTDKIGVIKIAKGAPIQIGGYWVLSGPDAALGIDQKRAVEVAIDEMGGTLMGHPLKLDAEDDGCTAEGGQTAATKLAANPAMVIVLGPICSSAAVPGAPILWKAGIVDVGSGATAPKLTAADRSADYDGFVRTIYNDEDQGASDAQYAYDKLGARKIVVIHDGSPYSQQLGAVMAAAFTKLGGTVLSTEAVAPTDVDMHPVLTKVAAEKPDLIYIPLFVAAAAQVVRQKGDIAGLADTKLLGSATLKASNFIEAAGSAVVGFKIGYPNVSTDVMGKDYPKLVQEYKTKFGELPISGYHANAYDAAMLAIKAIQAVAKTDSDGNLYIGRQALRDAVYATKFEGTAGEVACDEHGQCARFKPAVLEFTSSDASTFGDSNPKQIYP